MKYFLLISLLALAGCQTTQPATLNGGCRLFRDPGFAVQGKRIQDRRWIGATQEVGIHSCGWKRPTK